MDADNQRIPPNQAAPGQNTPDFVGPGGAPGDPQSIPPVLGTSLSIRTRLFGLALGLTVLAILIVLAVSANSANLVISEAGDTSTRSLRKQIEAYLVQVNQSMAVQSALILDRSVRDVQTVADATSAIYNGDIPLTSDRTELNVGAEGQAMNGADAISSLFVPNLIRTKAEGNPALAQAIQQDLDIGSNLDLTLQTIKENNPNASALYLGTSHDVLRYYPNIQIGQVVSADFSVTQRPWYISSLEVNPSHMVSQPVWSPVYFDATGLGLVTTIAEPVYTRQGDLVGVVGLDITLGELQTNIENARFLQTGYTFLIDGQGNAIILPEQGYLDLMGKTPDPDNPTPNLRNLIAEQSNGNRDLERILNNMQRGESGFEMLTLGGRELFIAYSPVRLAETSLGASGSALGPGWSLASIVPAEEVLAEVVTLQDELVKTSQGIIFGRILPIGILIALIAVALAWFGANRLVKPIRKLAAAAELLGAGEWDQSAPTLKEVQAQNLDEIGLLAGTLASMAEQLKGTIGQLEQRVAERTQQLEYRSLQLQTAAEIARDITLSPDLETLLQGAVDLIGDRFGFYNVGIFLVDELGEHAQLKVASGELGARLRQRDIRLRVGQQGMVGYVTRFGQPRLSDDVRLDQLYVAEPLLADTRSELTLPLRSGPKIIGALDVQSTQPAAFTQADLNALQTLANQLATAIENVRLVTQVQSALKETNQLIQNQTRQSWDQLVSDQGPLAFEYDLLEVRPVSQPTELAQATPAAPEPSGGDRPGYLRVPVRLRDEVIGTIVLESQDPDHVWSQDEITVVEATANQAGLTVENARLLEESQRRAQREQLAAQVTGRLRASLDMETVLQTAVREISQRLGIAQVEVQLGRATYELTEGLSPDATD
jgi:GAF domain-containing protein/HAMP domain-containing protein